MFFSFGVSQASFEHLCGSAFLISPVYVLHEKRKSIL